MRFFRNSFVWQFAGGFVLGAVGLLTLQPGDMARLPADYAAPMASQGR